LDWKHGLLKQFSASVPRRLTINIPSAAIQIRCRQFLKTLKLHSNENIFNGSNPLTAITSFGQKQLHIYGGKDHDVYLGCLNCDNYDSNSIWNAYGI